MQIAGVGSGFEATIGLRVRDGTCAQIARTFVNAGGTGALGSFAANRNQLTEPLGNQI